MGLKRIQKFRQVMGLADFENGFQDEQILKAYIENGCLWKDVVDPSDLLTATQIDKFLVKLSKNLNEHSINTLVTAFEGDVIKDASRVGSVTAEVIARTNLVNTSAAD